MGPVFIALDFGTLSEVEHFLDLFAETEQLAVKVGMELYYAQGPQIIERLHQRGVKIFLDLKLYDIPNTVQRAAFQLAQQKIDYLTIHAAGGSQMIQSAKEGLIAGSQTIQATTPKLLAITKLTSFSQAQMQAEQQISVSLPAAVTHLAQLAAANGADGVICSAQENQIIHQATNADFLCINPGIRLADHSDDDQQRIATPQAAKAWGSNGLVIGRPITRANNPVTTYQQILTQWRTN
ncbi:MAG: orotidine-5'-phosphate decarboxylase [Lactobacillus sp.]|uniref:orotidine-5'-phosphate decarboxylase n=1 Tax=Bombilactobacillus bombi TaxID=1303590 RepID=UPI0035E85BC8|nr:orotidine-5'-phosphate decarboxylase [Lactobacillus sp.]